MYQKLALMVSAIVNDNGNLQQTNIRLPFPKDELHHCITDISHMHENATVNEWG